MRKSRERFRDFTLFDFFLKTKHIQFSLNSIKLHFHDCVTMGDRRKAGADKDGAKPPLLPIYLDDQTDLLYATQVSTSLINTPPTPRRPSRPSPCTDPVARRRQRHSSRQGNAQARQHERQGPDIPVSDASDGIQLETR